MIQQMLNQLATKNKPTSALEDRSRSAPSADEQAVFEDILAPQMMGAALQRRGASAPPAPSEPHALAGNALSENARSENARSENAPTQTETAWAGTGRGDLSTRTGMSTGLAPNHDGRALPLDGSTAGVGVPDEEPTQPQRPARLGVADRIAHREADPRTELPSPFRRPSVTSSSVDEGWRIGRPSPVGPKTAAAGAPWASPSSVHASRGAAHAERRALEPAVVRRPTGSVAAAAAARGKEPGQRAALRPTAAPVATSPALRAGQDVADADLRPRPAFEPGNRQPPALGDVRPGGVATPSLPPAVLGQVKLVRRSDAAGDERGRAERVSPRSPPGARGGAEPVRLQAANLDQWAVPQIISSIDKVWNQAEDAIRGWGAQDADEDGPVSAAAESDRRQAVHDDDRREADRAATDRTDQEPTRWIRPSPSAAASAAATAAASPSPVAGPATTAMQAVAAEVQALLERLDLGGRLAVGQEQAEIELETPHLGKFTAKIGLEQGVVDLTIATHAAAAVTAELEALRTMLLDAGLQVGTVKAVSAHASGVSVGNRASGDDAGRRGARGGSKVANPKGEAPEASATRRATHHGQVNVTA